MIFKINELKKFIYSVSQHKIEHISITSSQLTLLINTVKHKNKIIINNHIDSIPKRTQKIINKNSKNAVKQENKNNSQEKNKYFTIISPMIGTFYRSPAPNEAPFIEINDGVKVNQTVCIIEAMKLMNEIESEVNGNIVEILVKDGDIVDCGQALMRVKQQ